MPLPLGHVAIGVAIHSCVRKTESGAVSWQELLFIAVLATLPDIDVIIGLLSVGNGAAFHRGPTHSLLFAIAAALLASRAWKLGIAIPKVSFLWSFLLVISHVAADAVLTDSPVSFFWPLEVNWSGGHSGWTDVIASVSLGAYRDAGIVLGSGLLIASSELLRHRMPPTQWGMPEMGAPNSLQKTRTSEPAQEEP
ncbi:MAG: metal-dependent hydrolase [Gammaproteobacteria bacterium]|nr:metal-dependent hydrolase [Gammaproteobacteria bacterium]MDJ0890091.1 metal-dependent hydrolase [Gammaproteobacteria bacterium]